VAKSRGAGEHRKVKEKGSGDNRAGGGKARLRGGGKG
jgi:hypothetical protein